LIFQGKPIDDKAIAFTLAVAMRKAVAAMLGIEVAEIGCEVSRITVNNGNGYVLSLYDVQSSGYVSGVVQRMTEVLHYTRQALECPRSCESSCPACLQHYDTRFRTQDLDRIKTLQLIGSGWVKNRSWDSAQWVLGSNTQVEYQSLVEAISRELAMPDVKELRIFLNGSPESWQVSQSGLKPWLSRWCDMGIPVAVVARAVSFDDCSDENHSALMAIAAENGAKLYKGEAQLSFSGTELCAELITDRGSIYWGESDVMTSIPKEGWGVSRMGELLRGLPQSERQMDLIQIS
jgi:hypothetical protein